MQEKMINFLSSYGLNKDEIRVYLAMLIDNYNTILKIAKATKIKRSTVYLIMDKLIGKNLVRISVIGKKKSYFVENPEQLSAEMHRRKKAFRDIELFIKIQYETHKEKPRVTFYEGREGVEKIYKEIANTKRTQEILWYGCSQDFEEEFGSSLLKLEKSFLKVRSSFGERIILNSTRSEREYGKKLMVNKRYKYPIKVRMLTSDLYFLGTDCCIYENKIALFSIKQDFFVIIIESQDIVNNYRMIFDLAWESSIKI